MDAITIFTDGACRGNPGPGGWAAVLHFGTTEMEISGGEPDTTNQRMELVAAIKALSEITNPRLVVRVYSDSRYLVDGMTRWLAGWKQNGFVTAAKTPVKNQDLWMELDHLASALPVRWVHVKAHAGNYENERADILAVAAIGRQTVVRKRQSW